MPLSAGQIKTHNADFRVVERLPEVASGVGEHLWLTLAKDGQNTAWVARQLARWAGLGPRDVSYAGLKDRHGLTEQTFSLHLPGKLEPSVHLLQVDGLTVVEAKRHGRKLKTGQLVGNSFCIRLRNTDVPLDQLARNWQILVEQGVPNYFGPQRFGHGGLNVHNGSAWLLGRAKAPRHLQSIYLSAVRSFLFNKLLAQRVLDGSWNHLIEGDFAQFTEGKAGFYCAQPEAADVERCLQAKVSPCASLPGLSKDDFPALTARESLQLAPYADLLAALEERQVARHFRKLRVFPEAAGFEVIDKDPVLSFFLPAGSFATSVLAELVTDHDLDHDQDQGQGPGGGDWHE
jgi:tRNA pseudouridine13 synthase